MLRTDTLEDTELGDDHETAAVAATVPAATVPATIAPATTAPATTVPAAPTAPADRGELLFQRCLWCGTPAYRRSFCRACGSVAFRRERSAGDGVVVRRHGQVPHHTWFVAMNEGFNLLCQATDAAPVAVGSRVSVVRDIAPLGQGLPVVEPTRPPTPDRWW
ncbi:zinc ribbon domain-containing protein [Streptomyces sp. NBC_00481]|uniref:Zn-ribbon domain-containing OB-fold protein n=1 Tax=unclassified Streptomyces TaxID=2593676 RepID=UPI002DDA5944|nr:MULTISPECIES: zinc ribbon domain-containing protein [unclassified Streptomyces]WRY94784.1 zinc ribbon domain-containing protein [Streptomyces sp. NBC_00481]